MGECLILKSGGGTDTSDATATSDQLMSGYTAYVNDVKLIGSMENKEEVSATLNCGGSFVFEAGYYSGGTISANSLVSQTDGTAPAAYILTNYNAWVKGIKVLGTMANRGNITATLGANGTYTIPSGYHAGSGTVKQTLTTQPGTTITPGTSNKTAVAASRWVTGTVWCKGDANLVPQYIKKGVWIFGVLGTWQGY